MQTTLDHRELAHLEVLIKDLKESYNITATVELHTWCFRITFDNAIKEYAKTIREAIMYLSGLSDMIALHKHGRKEVLNVQREVILKRMEA